MRGGARVTQGSGPFELTFEQCEDETTYMQIDGESLTVNNLKSIRISKTANIMAHQIIFMVKEQA